MKEIRNDELLAGVRAGTVEEEGTVNGLVGRRLYTLAASLKAFAPSGAGKSNSESGNDSDVRSSNSNGNRNTEGGI